MPCLALALVLVAPAFAAAPIRSQAELERYLELTMRANDTPLDALPQGAGERFLDSLQFGTDGLGGFATDDLAEHLTHAQVLAVLELFDAGQYADAVGGRDTIRAPRRFESEFEQRFDEFYRVSRSSLDDREAITLAYKRLLGSAQKPRDLASSLDTYDLELLYRAALQMVHGDADRSFFEYTRYLLDTLAQRDDATPARVHAFFDRLVTARAFDEADRLVDDFPLSRLKRLPTRNFEGAPHSIRNNLLQVDPDGRSLSRAVLDLDRGLRMVVVAGCHFAKDAATAVSADPQLDRWFHEHATWLAPEGEDLDAVAAWNRQFPRHAIQIAWSASDWPKITSWRMPTFYVFRDHELVAQWSGWAPESGMRQLREHLHALGMVPVADEFFALAKQDPEWLEENGFGWLASLPVDVRLQIAERAMQQSTIEVQLLAPHQFYDLGLDERGDAALAELFLQDLDLTGFAWGWMHSGKPGLMEARLAGIRRALLARYEVLTPEQQARAKELLQKQ
jgi:hypothetical protein